MPDVQITLGAILDAEPALTRLGERLLPATISYRVARMLTAITAEVTAFQATRDALIRRYGEVREATEAEQQQMNAPQVVMVRAEHRDTVTRELTALLAERVTLHLPALIDLSWLGDEPITPHDLARLDPLLANGNGGSPHAD
jgi:hypothetical protein